MKPLMIALMSTAMAAGMLNATPAHAGDWSNAVDVCQGSLPSFEGALRKRPLGIANEGTSSSFVSCSIRAPLADEEVVRVVLLLTNRGASAQNVSCTLINGVALPFPGYTPIYQPKAVSVAAGTFNLLQWTKADDNDDNPYLIPNLNCSLPVGVEINVVQIDTEAVLP